MNRLRVHPSAFLAVLLAVCACSQPTDGRISDAEPSHIISDELSNNKIKAFAEDRNGHMWIGTFRGLNKFDSHEYHQYFCNDSPTGLPDNQISDLYCDSRGRLWVATIAGICRYTEHDDFHRVPLDTPEEGVQKIMESGDGRIFIVSGDRLLQFDPRSDSFRTTIRDLQFLHDNVSTSCFVGHGNTLWTAGGGYIRSFSLDTWQEQYSTPYRGKPTRLIMSPSRNQLWLTGIGSLEIFETTRREWIRPKRLDTYLSASSDMLLFAHPYNEKSILLCTVQKGLLLYDIISGSIISHTDRSFPFNAPDFFIQTMFTDSQKNIWIGSLDQGYAVEYSYKEKFNNDNYLRSTVRGKSVMSISQDKAGNIFILTLMDGLYIYNCDNASIDHVNTSTLPVFNDNPNKDFFFVLVDDEDNVWLGSLMTDQVVKCRYDSGELRFLKAYDVDRPHMMTQGTDGTLWIGTSASALYHMPKGESGFSRLSLRTGGAGGGFISGILPLDGNSAMVLSLGRPPLKADLRANRVEDFGIEEGQWEECIRRSTFIPTDVFRDSSGRIWIGSVGNGLLLFMPDDRSIRRIEGCPCTDISSIEEDRYGNLWISSQFGLFKYNPSVNKFTSYYTKDGTGGNQFYDRASIMTREGMLYFGGTHGLTVFNPINISERRNVPLVFEDLKINNTLVSPSGNPETIAQALSSNPDINLSYRHGNFSISFAALDYCEQERAHYTYMLEGYDRDWVTAGNHEAYYANVPAGRYTFKVRITNNNNSIIDTESSIRVNIKPAPWLTWWAICLYVLFSLSLICLFLHLYWSRLREKEMSRQALAEKEQERRINRMNMNFFANISHEFRTPLTMISGPVSQLGQSPSVSAKDRELIDIVKSSISRMLRLVNQLMDFNKLEGDSLRLSVEWTDIIGCLRDIVRIFEVNAQNKNISLSANGLEGRHMAWADVDKIEKIINNLLFNALKFTPAGGRISLDFDLIPEIEARQILGDAMGSYIKISVSDSGSGIPEDQLEKIFERYYQLDSRPGGNYNWGTGIGLYYARQLAKLHHGWLYAGNRPLPEDISGAVFTLLLPIMDAAYPDDEHKGKSPEIAFGGEAQANRPETENRAGSPEKDDKDKMLIQIVDDDPEVIRYLKALLSDHYRIISDYDADNAYKAALEHHPDIILSDVAMPGTSGYSLCHRLKEDLQLCHIPVILVTAMSTIDNQVEGLNSGADAYVTKPFDPDYLSALIASLLRNREKARQIINKVTETDEIESDILSSADKAFMDKLYKLMEEEISDSELDMTHFTENLCMSRTKFYHKVKALTGTSPASFFKTYKLNRAAGLIASGEHTMSEIADMTGFSTLAHFSTSFKKQFGVSPSAWQKQA